MSDQTLGVGEPTGERWRQALRDIALGNGVVAVIAVLIALAVGSILIASTNAEVGAAASYFFARPTDTFSAIGKAVGGAYASLFQGAIYNFRVSDPARAIRPLTETLTFATPLIAAGLGVGLAFRAGMFNIGGRGQILIGASLASWVGFGFALPPVVHLVLAVLAGIVGAALWGAVAGVLKARTGAHEVIVTIMLNYVAFYLVSWLLATPGLLQQPGGSNPISPATAPNAILPPLFGGDYRLHGGFILAIAATIFAWWLLERSALGFRFRAVGENPAAARVAGINVENTYFVAMLISGGLVGIAAASQVLGSVTSGFTSDIDAGIGVDAITVALLGRSTPWGIFAAGLLFGAFKAGGFAMQAANGVSVDIVEVVQALIVLFIAAPPLVRAMFRIGLTPRRRRRSDQEKS